MAVNYLEKARNIHMIGIGGAGMCALAPVLRDLGYQVSGWDDNPSDNLTRLQEQGFSVQANPEETMDEADLVVCSAAIAPDHPGRLRAQDLGIPQASRAAIFGELSRRFHRVIAVSGTHGKTTATGMIAHLLMKKGRNPSAIVGGYYPLLGGNGRLGSQDCLVCEACEFQDTFLHLKRDTAVLLNIDDDHLEYFGDMEGLIRSFGQFLAESQRAVVYGEDPRVLQAVKGLKIPVTTFGFGQENDHYTNRVSQEGGLYSFDWMHRGNCLGRVSLSVCGRHQIPNALAAAAVALQEGLSPQEITEGLGEFSGVCRRFQVLCRQKGITVADDYAHHPTELEAVLTAARQMGFRKIIAVFQPFTFSRTYLLMKEFARVLSLADGVVLTPILGSREINTFGVTTEELCRRIPGAVLGENEDEVAKAALAMAEEGDLILTLGCGDVYKIGKNMVKRLCEPSDTV